jgi:hypothetical protein
MPTCPAGHDTVSTDFCDVCGVRLGAAAPLPQRQSSAASLTGPPCPRCGTHRSGQFCETCGYDFASGAVPRRFETAPAQAAAGSGSATTAPESAAVPGSVGHAASGPGTGAEARSGVSPGAWMAVVTADRAYFDSVVAAGGPDAATLEFPVYCPERRFRLSGSEVRIGRRSASRGLEPEIDLTGPPTDPGVSHLHAVLIAEPDGSWAVLDPGSANGTLVNGREMAAGARIRLREGDRVCVGAWTVLTIRTVF